MTPETPSRPSRHRLALDQWGSNVPNRRSTDVTRLSFPLQIVVFIVTSSVTATVSIWASQSSLRSDVRDIRTRMETAVKLDEANAKLRDEQMDTLKRDITELKGLYKLQDYEIRQLKEIVLKIQPK